jgi:drug/metabolite transporter (DMT)-like permease
MDFWGERTDKTRGLSLVLLSTAAYGTMPILAKVAYASGLATAGLLAARFVLATLLFTLLAWREAPLPFRSRCLLWGISCVFAANSFAYFEALETLPASRVVLLFYVYPVIVTLLSAGIGLEALTIRGLAAAGLAMTGAALTAGSVGGRTSGWGVFLALSASLLYATFIVLVSRFAAGIAPGTAARHVAQLSALVFVIFAAGRGESVVPSTPAAWGAVLSIAVVSTVVAHQAFLAGLARIGPARAAVASSLEMVVTVALAVIFLGEVISARQCLGGALILSAVVLQNVGRLWMGSRGGSP